MSASPARTCQHFVLLLGFFFLVQPNVSDEDVRRLYLIGPLIYGAFARQERLPARVWGRDGNIHRRSSTGQLMRERHHSRHRPLFEEHRSQSWDFCLGLYVFNPRGGGTKGLITGFFINFSSFTCGAALFSFFFL